MNKKCYRFFGTFFGAQTRWLNRMAADGWRLVRTGKVLYEFESCEPDEYRYCVEFVAEMSKVNSEKYKAFLEDLGYTVFYKNANLNYSVGKVRWRPWAENGARLATNAATFNRELLIVEKKNDGKPFELHTTNEDRLRYAKKLRGLWMSFAVLFLLCAVWMQSWVFGGFGIAAGIPAVLYQLEIRRLAKDGNVNE